MKPLKDHYYTSHLKIKGEEYFISFNGDSDDFNRIYNKLKRHYHFRDREVKILSTNRHEYVSVEFKDKEFEG